jgi:hypothetical protein
MLSFTLDTLNMQSEGWATLDPVTARYRYNDAAEQEYGQCNASKKI